MLQVLVYKESGVFAAYAPALDLFGYGETEEVALKSLEIVLEEFIQYAVENDTLRIELKRLGWEIGKKDDQTLRPPTVESMIKNNPVVSDIYNNREFSQKKKSVPVFA